MKRYHLKPGDILEIHIPKKGYFYTRVLGKDDFAFLFEFFDPAFPAPLKDEEFASAPFELRTIAYVNPPGAKAAWPLRIRRFPGSTVLPARFYGSPKYGWTVVTDKGPQNIGVTGHSYEALLEKGYVHSALWLPKSIEEYLATDKPLRWTMWPS